MDKRDKVHVISILSQRYKKNGNANCSHQADIHILKKTFLIDPNLPIIESKVYDP